MVNWNYVFGGGASGTVLMIAGAWAQSKIRVWEQRDSSQLRAETSPIEVMKTMLSQKDAVLAQTQAQVYQFMNAQMAKTEAQTKAMLDVSAELRAQTEAIKALAVEIKAGRDEQTIRAGKVYEKLEHINLTLTKVEGGVEALERRNGGHNGLA